MELDISLADVLSEPRKRRAWISYQLDLRGLSLNDVARSAGVKRQTLYQAFVVPYPKMERIIAKAIGLNAQVLFPERYTANGAPNRRMGRPPKKRPVLDRKDTRRAPSRNTQAAGGV